MQIEHITEKQLLLAYLARAYRNRGVLVINMGEVIDSVGSKNSEISFRLMTELAGLLGGELPRAFQMVGYVIIETNNSMQSRALLSRFQGAPFHLEFYFGDELIDDNYSRKERPYEIQEGPCV